MCTFCECVYVCVCVCASKNLIQEQSLYTLFISVRSSQFTDSLVARCFTLRIRRVFAFFLVPWITTRSCWLLPTFWARFPLLLCLVFISSPHFSFSVAFSSYPHIPRQRQLLNYALRKYKAYNPVACVTKLYEKGWKNAQLFTGSCCYYCCGQSLLFPLAYILCKLMLVCDFVCYLYTFFNIKGTQR